MAELSYRQAIALEKDSEEYYLKAAEFLARQLRADDAMLLLENGLQYIAKAVPRAKILNNLGLLKMEQAGRDFGMLEEALQILDLSRTLDPGCFNALLNSGLTLDAMGRYGEAYSFYKGAVAIRPKDSTSLLGIGNYLFRVGRYNESIAMYEEAAAQGSDGYSQPHAVFMIGQAHRFGLYNQASALQAYERALSMAPSFSDALLGKIQTMRAMAMWKHLEEFDAHVRSTAVEQITAGTGEKKEGIFLPMYDSLFNAELTPGMVKAVAESHALKGRQSGEFWPRSSIRHTTRELARTEDGHPFGLNVVYLSFDFREHPMGYLTKGLVCGHDGSRALSLVASYGQDDGSTPRKFIEQCARHFERFLDIRNLSDEDAALKIHQTSPHILVDFMGGTTGARDAIVNLRPSPIILNYLGFPSTIGSAADFFVVDARVVPPESVRYTVGEQAVVYLPDAYQANDYTLHDKICLPSSRKIPCEKNAREARGLRSDAPTLCNFNSIDKLEPNALSLALQVISRVPGSVLVLLSPPAGNLGAVQQNIALEAAAQGVDPKRILLEPRLPKGEHIERTSALCDLFIDSLVYRAHTTAADALWAGVPLVTVGGFGVVDKEYMAAGMPGRVAHSLLSAVGFPELSTSSLKTSIDVCVSLLRSKSTEYKKGGGALYVLRKRILHATLSSPVFDTKRTIRAMEAAYEAVWEQWIENISPFRHVLVGHEQKLKSPSPESRISELDNLLIAYDQSKGDPTARERARSASYRMISSANVRLVGPRLAWTFKLMQGAGEWQDSVIETTRAALICYLLNSNQETRAWEILGHSLLRAVREDVKHSAWWSDTAQSVRLILLESTLRTNVSNVVIWGTSSDTADDFLALIKSYSPVINVRASLLAFQSLLVAESRFDDLAVLHAFGVSYESPMQLAAVIEREGRREEAYEAYRKAVINKNAVEFTNVGRQYLQHYGVPGIVGQQLVIGIYCHEYGQAWFPNWGPSSLESGGLGGSEEAVVFMSRYLSDLGYRVEIYADPLESDMGTDEFGVVWYSTSMFDAENPPHIFISWRYHASLPLGKGSAKTFLWLQDVPTQEYPPQLKDEIDGIFCLSSFHTSMIYPQLLRSMTHVTPIGVDPSQFVDGKNHPLRFVYGSAPNRGLESVLIAWPYIVERLKSKLKHCE